MTRDQLETILRELVDWDEEERERALFGR